MSSNLLQTLKDPFASDCPTFLDKALEAPEVFAPSAEVLRQREKGEACSPAKKRKRVRNSEIFLETTACAAVTPRGSYLAHGMLDTGFVAIRDLLTQQIVAKRKVHDGTVSSVAYMPGEQGRILVTCGEDGTLKVLDLARDFECVCEMELDCPATTLIISREKLAVVSRRVDERNSDRVPWPIIIDLKEGKVVGKLEWELDEKAKKPSEIHAVFSSNERFVLVGGFNGEIKVFNALSLELVATENALPQTRGGWIRQMVMSESKHLLVQIVEKVVHMMKTEGSSLKHVHDFQDSVEKTKWSCFTMSPDGEYVVGCCASHHELHLWNVLGRHMSNLRSSDRGMVRAVVWHPCRPIVFSFSRDGRTLVWSTHRTESWTAFAPNFVQLEENETYKEREDEFDKNPRVMNDPSLKRKDEDQVVEVFATAEEPNSPKEFFLPLKFS